MSVGCKIMKDFQRPAPELVALFKDMPVANIDDNMNRMAAVDAAIEPVGYKGQLLGTAFTVRVPQGDNLMFHAAMDLAKPGDVIVIDAGGFTDRAIFGEINVPVVVGGKLVYPGDIVVGDDDGVLFIRPQEAEALAKATEAVEKKEAEIMRHILEDGTYIRPWVDAKLKEIGCEILE